MVVEILKANMQKDYLAFNETHIPFEWLKQMNSIESPKQIARNNGADQTCLTTFDFPSIWRKLALTELFIEFFKYWQ